MQYPEGATLKWNKSFQAVTPDEVQKALDKAVADPMDEKTGKSKIKNNSKDNSLFGKATGLSDGLPDGMTLLEYFVKCLHAWATSFKEDPTMTGLKKPLLNVYFNAKGTIFLEPILTRHVNLVLKRIEVPVEQLGGRRGKAKTGTGRAKKPAPKKRGTAAAKKR